MQYNYPQAFLSGGHPYAQSPSLQQQQSAAEQLNQLAGSLTGLIEGNQRGGGAIQNYSRSGNGFPSPGEGREQDLMVEESGTGAGFEGQDEEEEDADEEGDDEEYTEEQAMEFRRMGERRALLEQGTNIEFVQARAAPERRTPYASTSSNGNYPHPTHVQSAPLEPWDPLLDHSQYLNEDEPHPADDLQIFHNLPSTSSTHSRQEAYVPDDRLDTPEYEEEEEEVVEAPPPNESGAQPFFVNAKQYHRIIKRRAARLRLEEMGRLHRQRKVSPLSPPLCPLDIILCRILNLVRLSCQSLY